MRSSCARVLPPFVAFLALFFLACDDHGTDPGDPVIHATIDRLWPNADGNSWTFDYEDYMAEGLPPAVDGLDAEHPDALDWRDLYARLRLEAPEADSSEAPRRWEFRYAFDGTVDVYAGTKQKLVTVQSTPAKGVMSRSKTGWPLPLNDGYDAFEKRADWIGFYPPADYDAPDSIFTLVQGPLVAGNTFRQQLAAYLADDMGEYGWIAGERSLQGEAGSFSHVVDVVYYVDFGIDPIIDEGGHEIGEARSFELTLLSLAEDVGPVYQRRYLVFMPIPAGEEFSGFVAYAEQSLVDYEIH